MVPEQWIAFVQDKWWVILAAVVALLVVVSVVKTVLKWVLALAIVAAVLTYGANYKDELTTMSDQMLAEAKDQAFQALVAGAIDAQYESKADGTYAVFTSSVRVEGKEGSNEVTVFWKGVRIGTFEIDATIRAFLDGAKHNS
ncbi:hypothetical protein [Paenibacillus sp.]|uniref:hypothetical protein n=1 Tax=Paenibacillus sp. TaxID=58172 RepID=UPI002D52F37F|nr:hypothetical protein [Paenibacillus sp.]HZG57589.1 hypothetical protein [Paenibacillus sp.]